MPRESVTGKAATARLITAPCGECPASGDPLDEVASRAYSRHGLGLARALLHAPHLRGDLGEVAGVQRRKLRVRAIKHLGGSRRTGGTERFAAAGSSPLLLAEYAGNGQMKGNNFGMFDGQHTNMVEDVCPT